MHVHKPPEGHPTVRSSASTSPETAQSISDHDHNQGHGHGSVRVMLHRTLILMKPHTWFAPSWAFLCGAVASGALAWSLGSLTHLLLGIFMAGPVLCGLSQVVNDYCDRDVDAINEPNRLIPSGMVSLRAVQTISVVLTVLGTIVALYLGREVALFVGIGLLFALSYSLKPIRAKRNGWVGNALVAFSYEGLAWLAGHAVFAALSWESITFAFLYSISAHGIMTVNDFKSIEGDLQMGIRSIPVMYGKKVAAWLVVIKMSVAQVGVIGLLYLWGNPIAASVVLLLLLAQIFPFKRFILDPEHHAVFFNTTAIMLSVLGMLVAAIGLVS